MRETIQLLISHCRSHAPLHSCTSLLCRFLSPPFHRLWSVYLPLHFYTYLKKNITIIWGLHQRCSMGVKNGSGSRNGNRLRQHKTAHLPSVPTRALLKGSVCIWNKAGRTKWRHFIFFLSEPRGTGNDLSPFKDLCFPASPLLGDKSVEILWLDWQSAVTGPPQWIVGNRWDEEIFSWLCLFCSLLFISCPGTCHPFYTGILKPLKGIA